MSTTIKLNHNDMCVSVEITPYSDYNPPSSEFLNALSTFLTELDFYESVSIEMRRVQEREEETLDMNIHPGHTATDFNLYPGNDIRVTLD